MLGVPELPEVETVRNGLRPALEGRRLTRVLARRPDLRFPLPDRFAERLTGAQVLTLDRRAKYLLASLDTGETLVMHLGMTGRFHIESPAGEDIRPGDFAKAAPADPRHAHVVFDVEGGGRITYFDARRFGFMGLAPTQALADHPWFKAMGPEPLGEAFTPAYLGAALRGRSQNIKALLLNQKVAAGLGNIYVCEALHRAGVSPLKAGGELKSAALARLTQAIRAVLLEAIAAGGSTLRDYAGADGALGYFQHVFQVYGREHHPCLKPACGGTIRRIVQAGRSTFFCPLCQR